MSPESKPNHAPDPAAAPKLSTEDELRNIYSEQDGQLPDLTKLDKQTGSGFRRFLLSALAVLIVLSGIAWAGFFVWTKGFFQSNDILIASIEGPTQVESGEKVTFTIRYQNTGQNPLANLDLKLNLPLGFELTESVPEPNSDDLTWLLGSLTPGSDGAISVSGVFRSEVPNTQTFQALFTYRPANVSSDFQSIETLSIEINNSVLELAITGPAKALAGDEVTYAIDVQNTGSSPVKDIRISALIPPDFIFASSEPAPSAPDLAQWHIESLEPNEQRSVTLIGSYTSSAAGEQTLSAEVALLEENNVVLTQKQTETLTDVLGGTIMFHLIIDGGTQSLAADPGKNLLVSIDYANNGNETIEDLILTLELEPAEGKQLPINWEASNLEPKVIEGEAARPAIRQGNTLTWDSSIIPGFASLAPNSEGVIDFIMPIFESIDPAAAADSFTYKLTAHLSKVGSIVSPRTIESTPLTVSINSDLRGGAEVRYFDDAGQPLGSGELPPKVDQTTTFRVFWFLENSLHALEDVRLTTNLPPDVAWTGGTHTDIGTLEYNNTTRLVTWKIDKLPTDVKEAQAYFDVAITPDENDVGAFVKLTNATSIDALDTKTRDNLASALDILTTEMPTDETARGQGVVIE
ncbi:DUF11 domain-containing protein [Patescibacteria group bacterium]|nr:DUF11 domain-containing protein [Patescibacteria group bacterium]